MLIAFFSVFILIKNYFSCYYKLKIENKVSSTTVSAQEADLKDFENVSPAPDNLYQNLSETKKTSCGSSSSVLKTVNFITMSNFSTQPNIDSDSIAISAASGIIAFKTGDKQYCYEINDLDTIIVGSAGNHDHGSSKVKLKNIVDYKWETKYYPGHLIAVHIDGKHIAYVINVNNKASRTEGMVRVANAQTGLRALIKGMSGEVLDLQFAHNEKDKIIASIDVSSLYVHKIDTFAESLLCNLIIKVEDPLSNYTINYDKISWCPYVDCNGDDDEENSQLIVWSRGSLFQVFSVKTIVDSYGIGKIQPSELATGYLKFQDSSQINTWVALSPDGTTLGVGSEDGKIRFYQVYFHEKEPRCLHQWTPHNGKAVSSFFFLDNLTRASTDTYWKYALTAAEDNAEFKIWDCSSWECLQTIKIKTSDEKKYKFIAELDQTSSYLVVSNMDTRVLYIFQIITNNNRNRSITSVSGGIDTSLDCLSKSKNPSKNIVYIKCVSEFPLSSAILSFSIVDAAVRRYKCANDNYLIEEMDDYDEETNSIYCVVVRMYIVQPKSVQECRILYQPSVDESADVRSTISNSSTSKDFIENEIHNSSKSNKDYDDDDDETFGNEPGLNTSVNRNKQTADKSLESLLAISSQQTSAAAAGVATAVATSSLNVVTNQKTESPNISPKLSTPSSGHKSYSQVNLMTPDAFSSITAPISDKKTPECVSSEVLSTILMLASVTGSNATANKPDNVNLLNLVNNKIIEDQEHQKQKKSMETQKKYMVDNNSSRTNAGDNLASGGSSPSREVQEIMSLQEYECRKNSFSGDELDQEKLSANVQANIENTLTGKVDTDSITAKSQTSTTSVSSSSWPKVPDVRTVSKHSAELQNAANLISHSAAAAAAVASVNNSNINSSNHGGFTIHSHSHHTLQSNSNSSSGSANNGSELSEINMKMNQLIDMVKMQSVQINSLQNEIVELKKSNPTSTVKNLTEFSFKLEMQLSKLMEQYLKRYESEHKKKLSAFLAGRDVQNRDLRDSFLQGINQFVLTQLTDIISKVVTIEMQRQIMPMLAAKVDNMQQQIQMDVAQKLASFELMLKENISQVCKSKSIIDAFGKSVLVGVQGSLQAAFIESMSGTLIPAYEKSSQNMFKQLHEAFSVGIKEFMEQFDNYLSHLQPMQDSTDEILNKFSGFRQHLDSILVKHRNMVTDTMMETRNDIKNLEVVLSRQITDVVRSEVRKSFETQTVSLRSQSSTPAPSIYDVKDQIKLLLSQGHVNKAFHQALLANDLSLVEFTLNKADPNTVFHPCCLEQKVLLSLIQQISADMRNHNEIKQNYLADAILSISPSDPITREHAPKVMQELYRNCHTFLVTNTKSPQCSNVRMLMKAIENLNYVKQF